MTDFILIGFVCYINMYLSENIFIKFNNLFHVPKSVYLHNNDTCMCSNNGFALYITERVNSSFNEWE